MPKFLSKASETLLVYWLTFAYITVFPAAFYKILDQLKSETVLILYRKLLCFHKTCIYIFLLFLAKNSCPCPEALLFNCRRNCQNEEAECMQEQKEIHTGTKYIFLSKNPILILNCWFEFVQKSKLVEMKCLLKIGFFGLKLNFGTVCKDRTVMHISSSVLC